MSPLISQSAALLGTLALCGIALGATTISEQDDPGWPRVFTNGKQHLTVHQPQVDYWNGYTNLHFRCAIAVKTNSAAREKFGVAEIDAATQVDDGTRVVTVVPVKREFRFQHTAEAEAAVLRTTVDQLHPPRPITVSLDRVLAYLDPAANPHQRTVPVNMEPPKIFFSSRPAILVIFLGPPRFQPVAKAQTNLLFAINTNWDMFYDAATQSFYLLNGDSWLSAPTNGAWTAASQLPASFASVPPDDNWAEVRKNIPAKTGKPAPNVFVSNEAAELILTEGDPSYRSIRGTQLQQLGNTDSLVFVNSTDGDFYLLAAGRWFRAHRLDGPWKTASRDLPEEFANIPDNDPVAFVKASVPRTREARDAVLLASVPSTTTVIRTNVIVKPAFAGAPRFLHVPGTTIQAAANSPQSVFRADGNYYWCERGAWLCSTNSDGPWAFCADVPQSIYTIPSSNSAHNVTYVSVQSSTATNITYAQTSGYGGEYVADTEVLMFGSGLVAGEELYDDPYVDYYYYPPPVYYYSYGCGAWYDYAYGGYYVAAYGWTGPYGGVGRAAAYNPATGTYSRGGYAYGPYASGSIRQAYNPYTRGYVQSARVNTAYSSAGRFYAQQGGRYAWGGYRTTAAGTGAAAWNTSRGQGAAVKTRSGDVYAGSDGTVYRRDPSGNWSRNDGGGSWQPVARHPAAQGGAASPRPVAYQPQQQQNFSQNLEYQAAARDFGNERVQQTRQFQPARRGGGGRRR